jgi:hypothetical protein
MKISPGGGQAREARVIDDVVGKDGRAHDARATGKWQATAWSGASSRSAGTSTAQRS